MSEVNFYLFTSFVLLNKIYLFTAASTSTSGNLFLKTTSYINAFSGCTIRIVNFPGYNLDGASLHEPVILLRYFSLFDTDAPFPVEISHYNYSQISKYFNKGNHITYANFAYTYKLKNSNKNMKCETELMVEPPDYFKQPSIYIFLGHWQIKHPAVFSWHVNLKSYVWLCNIVNTFVSYSILVTSRQIPDDACYYFTCQSWLKTVYRVNRVSVVHTNLQLIVWNVLNEVKILAHCAFCDPCRPHMFIQSAKIGQNLDENNWLVEIFHLLKKRRRTYSILISLPQFVPNSYLTDANSYTMKKVVRLMNRIDLRENFIQPKVTHFLTISAIAPKNASLRFRYPGEDMEINKFLWLSECPQKQFFIYPPYSRVEYTEHISPNGAEYPVTGLIIHYSQLRFVACHLEGLSWFTRLKELVSPFDAATLILGFMSIFTMAYLINIQLYKWRTDLQFGTACEALFALLLEKGHKAYDWSKAKSKPLGYFITLGIPFVLIVLSNEYRGDNISKLTVEPDLYPFDNFDDLVKHNFSVYGFPRAVLNEYFAKMFKHNVISKGFGKVSNLEIFPIVSQCLYEILNHNYQWSEMNTFEKGLGNRTRFYLKHSHLYGENKILKSNSSEVTHFLTDVSMNWKDHAFEHLKQCNFAALIMYQNEALVTYTNMSSLNAPVFLGKDIIYENLLGYRYVGKIPEILHFRAKNFYESGILDFWRKYFDYLLIWRTKTYQKHGVGQTSFSNLKSYSAVFIILFIPAIGLLLSFLLYIFEIKKTIWQTIKNLATAFWLKWRPSSG